MLFPVPTFPLHEALPSLTIQVFSAYREKEYLVFRSQVPSGRLCPSVPLILTSVMCSPEFCLLTCFPSSSWNLPAYTYLNEVGTFHRTAQGSLHGNCTGLCPPPFLYSSSSQSFTPFSPSVPSLHFLKTHFFSLGSHIQHFLIFTSALQHWGGCFFPLSSVAHGEGQLPPRGDWAWATRSLAAHHSPACHRRHYRQKDPSTLLEGSKMPYAPYQNREA